MRRKSVVFSVLVAVACLFFAAGLYAAVKDVVKINMKDCPVTKGDVPVQPQETLRGVHQGVCQALRKRLW